MAASSGVPKVARYDGHPAEECLRYAVACGAESTQHFGAGSIDPAEVGRLLPGVESRERNYDYFANTRQHQR